ncbi:tape measure protein [Acinetobacter pullicarnis]|uniref:tape measure protein n=1 Tax=Acinetobacter pullicarnis TaxID=2576829 RepID=UPI00111FB622|nr:tape measure protein [Acinetobacter pullicarnis]
MTQESRLVIVIDSKNAEKNTVALREELTKIFNEGNKASGSTEHFGASAKSAGNSAQGMAASVGTSTRALDEQAKKASENTNAIKEMAKVVAGFIAIDKGIAMADGYTQMAARIRIATSSTEEYNLVQKRLFETANTTYRSLAEAQEVYLGIESSIKLMGKTTIQALDVTDAMSFAFTANATAADKAQSALNAYSKSLDQGKVGNDQWISIMQAIPGIASDISKYLKESGQDALATEQKVREMGISGKVSVGLMTDALEANKGKYKDLADSMDNSFKDGLTTLTNSVTKFLGELNMATKGTNTLAAGLGILGENVDKIAILGGIAASIYAGRLAQAFVISAQKAAWNTVAMVTQAGAMTTAATAAKNLYWALGGPVGVIVGVAGTVASMYMLRDSAKETTPVLDKQNKSVKDLTEEYVKLDEAAQRQATRDQINEIDGLTKTYDKQVIAMTGLGRVVMNNTDLTLKDREAAKSLYEQYIKGEISAEQFATSLNNLSSVNKELKERIDKQASATIDSNTAMQLAINIRDAFLGKSKETVTAHDNESEAIKRKKAALDALNGVSEEQNAKNELWMRNVKAAGGNKYATEWANFIESWKDKNKLPLDKALDEGQLKIAQKEFLVAQDRAKLQDKITQAAQATTKELKEQAKISKGLGNGMVSNSHLKGLPIKSGESTSGGKVRGYTAEFAQILGKELKSSIGAFTGFNDKYHQGKGGKHPQGQAFDLRLNNGANSANVDAQIKALADKYGYVVKTLDEYKNPSKNATGGHMHVSVTGRKGGSSSASDYLKQQKADIKDQKDAEREAEQAAKNRVQLEMNVADQVTKIKMKLAEDLKEVDKAGFSDDQAKALRAKYQAQADSEIELAKFALKTKIDDFSDFQKTEMQMLEKSYAQKKVYAMQDLELNANERKEAVALLETQLQIEKGYLELAKEQRLFQMRQQFLTESQAMQERYRLEELELGKINDVQERNFKRQMNRLEKEVEARKQLQSTAIAWANIESQMGGSTGRAQVEQDRFSRTDASQQVFDAQMNGVNMGEQDAMDRIQEQRSQDLITQQQFEDQKTAIIQTAMETRQAIYDGFSNRQIEIENAYQLDSINLQMTQAQQLTGSFAGMFKGILGESSSAYRAMYATQQAFALAQAGMNMWSSASKAYNDSLSPTVWGRMADAGKAMLDQGTFIAMIQAATPRGFATGGYVRGPGTSTSDSIPTFLSDKEFVVKASSVQSIGVDNLNAMNQTGQLPQVQRERRQAQAIGAATLVQPKITIINQTSQPVQAESEWDGNELKVILTEMQKQNEAMVDQKIEKRFRMSGRQGW